MKTILLALLTSFAFLVQGQTPDTAAVRVEVDSLITLNRRLVKERKFGEALQVIEQAELKCITAFRGETALLGTIVFNIGRTYHLKGDNPNAETYYLKAKQIQEKTIGKEHPDFAQNLYNLGYLYNNMGNYKKAEPFYLEAKSIREKTLGKEHPLYTTSLNNLGILYNNMGNYKKAESMYLETKSIHEKTLGKGHPLYTSNLSRLGDLYRDMGNYEKAESMYLEVKSIREKTLGKEHPDYANILTLLGSLYHEIGNFEEAESHYFEVKRIRRKVLGKENADYAGSLINLGYLYFDMANYENAESHYLEAKNVFEANESLLQHPWYHYCLVNLGVLYWSMGNYEKAEPFYLEVKTKREKTLGKEHPDYALLLDNMGNLYTDMGNYEKAELLYLETKKILEEVEGKEHLHYAANLINLGALYYKVGQKEKAEALFLEAKNIFEANENLLEHKWYMNCLISLGTLYGSIGQKEKAETFLLKAKIIREKVLGKEHPDYAQGLNNLGGLYRTMGQKEKAEIFLLEAKRIREKVLGKEHLDYTLSLIALAKLYWDMERKEKAETLYLEASEKRKLLLLKATRHLSERELLSYTSTFIDNQDQLLSFASIKEEVTGTVYDNSLFHKGFLLNATQQVKRLAQNDSLSNELFLRLKGYNRRLATAYSNPIKDRDNNTIAGLEEKANTLEKELTRSVAGYGDALRQVSWQEVQTALPETAIALEFVHFQDHFPRNTDSIMYAALLVRSGATQPLFIPLFEEKELDHLLRSDKERKSDYVNELYAWADRGMVKLGSEKKSLYDLIWAKIEAAGLEGIKKIYYSPSGVLHRLNLGAIAVDDETILSDQYNLVALNSTRQLVIPSAVSIKSNDALLVGGVNFEVDSIQLSYNDQPPLANRSTSSTWSEAGTRGGSWSYLNWTEKEVERISTTLTTSAFGVQSLSGREAAEESIKSLGTGAPSPRILHMATHGFFFPDPESKNQEIEIGEAEPVFKMSDNPMIRSGLILAGGNYAWQNGRAPRPDMEDGILTAYEISQMNLSNTELVVLSACETGLGDIEGNEGVYGLQRAFKIAGAKYLIMSLWQVPDKETMEFMTTFYKNWLPSDAEALAGKEGKLSIPDAFRKTQLEMRDRFFNPYSWAGFVLVE